MSLRRFLLDNRDQLGGKNYREIAAYCNERSRIPNPEGRKLVQKSPPTIQEFLAIVWKSGSIGADITAINKVAQLIESGNSIGRYLGVRSNGNVSSFRVLIAQFGLSTAALDALDARLGETELDPEYVSETEGVLRYPEGPVTVLDIQQAINS